MFKLLVIVLFSSFLYAQSSLNQIIDVKDDKTIVSLNFDSIEQINKFSFYIDSSTSIVFDINKYEKRNNGFKLVGVNVENNSTLILTSINGKVFGSITSNDEKYSIIPYENNYYQIIKNDKSKVKEIDSHGKKNPNTRKAYSSSIFSTNNLNLVTSNSNEMVVIDVLILYTEQIQNYYGDALNALIQNYVDIANESLENSQVNVKLNLINTMLYQNTYASEDYNIDTALNQITNDLDVKALKRLYNVDMISLFRQYEGSGSCGLAYVLDDLSVSSAYNSLSVVEVKDSSQGGYYCSDTTFIHELGHNFGCDHDRDHASLSGLFSYSYGYDIPGIFATIMSYDNPTINYFSNPDILYNGYPIGIAEGNSNSADCSKTIRNSKSIIANHNLNEDLENSDVVNNNQMTGTLSDDNDRDAFLFLLSGNLNFKFNLSGYYVNIYDDKQRLITSSDRDFSRTFDEGKYYLVISSFDDESSYFYSQEQYSYNIDIAKNDENSKITSLTNQQKAFIERFYQNIMGRTADSGGMTTWLNTIQNESATKVALGFFNSQEFINKNLTNEQFIDILYKTLFDRIADSSGRTDWLNKLQNGATKNEVMYGFFNAQEFKNLADRFGVTQIRAEDQLFKTTGVDGYVNRFYTLVLNRTPDENGYNDWIGQLNSGTKAGGDIAKGFFNSQEYLNRGLDNSIFLDICYKAFFDREADSGGKSNWTILLNQGTTKDQILDGFIDSQEFINLANKFGIKNR